MYNIIKNYIKNITIDDINIFASKNNITLKQNETNTIYNVLKNDLDSLLYNSDELFLKHQKSFTVENYNKIYQLFNEYKKRYIKFLI